MDHNKEAKWLQDFRKEMERQEQQGMIEITEEKIRKLLQRLPNWKAPGPDMVQGYWFKYFTSMHKSLKDNLADCLKAGKVPEWMTKGKTVLIQKDPAKGNDPSNYRPITCLPLAWKILTGIIAEETYTFLEQKSLLPEEQKGCRKGSRGTGDLLYIDRMLLQEVKRRNKNLAMAWIDYRKAYDLVPHSWILECLENLGVNEEIRRIVKESMKSWKVELTYGNDVLGEVKIERGIFQGDSLSPLLFVIILIPLTHILRKASPGYEFASSKEKINHLLYMDDLKLYSKTEKTFDSLIQTVRIFSNDIKMEFGIEKCAILVLKRGKVVKSEGIKLPDNRKMRSLNENEGYKYLGILQADQIKQKKMKEKVGNEYKRRVRKLLETKLNGQNIINAINTRAIPLLRYSAAFLGWTKEEIQQLDRKTRKLLTMHGVLHPKSNVDRLYIPRKEGGRGLLNVEDVINLPVIGLERYVCNSTERLLTAARAANEYEGDSETEYKLRKKNERCQAWKEKTLHGQFLRQTENEAGNDRWNWLRNTGIKRGTESMIMAAQEQAIRTNVIKAKIDKTQEKSKCRMCGQVDETVNHIISECSKLAQKEYKRRHDWFGKRIHWEVCRKNGIEVKPKWYEHQPEAVQENERYKILWDFNIQTDHVIEARRPDMIVIDKETKFAKIIDFAIPYDSRVNSKEVEKIEKYQDLAREIKKLWGMRVIVIPIVIGTLGTTPKKLKKRLEDIGIETRVTELQKAVILHSARILRKVLEI